MNDDSSYLDWEKKGYVSVWLGNFSSKDEFDLFFEEKIDGDAETTMPINRFAEAIGCGFYDHDFQEAIFFGAEKLPVRRLLAAFSYSSSYLEEAARAADEKNIHAANAMVMLFDWQFAGEIGSASPIRFLGNFRFDENAPFAAESEA